jgi:hypothetical protein
VIKRYRGIIEHIKWNAPHTEYASESNLEDFNIRLCNWMAIPLSYLVLQKTGRTQFALAHFDRPLLVSKISDLKYKYGCDGQSYKGMNFTKLAVMFIDTW